MHKKTYKTLVLILVALFSIPIAFFFASCKNKKNENLNPTNADIFQEIATYIQQNGKEDSVINFEGKKDKVFTIKHTNGENSFDYYPERNILSIYGYTTEFSGVYFTIYIPHFTAYSSTNYFVDGAMAIFSLFQLTLPNTPRYFTEGKNTQEGHRIIQKYDMYTYDADKKEAVSATLARIMTENLKAFSNYFQDKTSLLNIENAPLYYFHLPLSVSIQVN